MNYRSGASVATFERARNGKPEFRRDGGRWRRWLFPEFCMFLDAFVMHLIWLMLLCARSSIIRTHQHPPSCGAFWNPFPSGWMPLPGPRGRTSGSTTTRTKKARRAKERTLSGLAHLLGNEPLRARGVQAVHLLDFLTTIVSVIILQMRRCVCALHCSSCVAY